MDAIRITLLWLIITVTSYSANIYVRDGGIGDGSAWDNALDQIPTTITRGDTVYLADGSYSAITFDDAVSSTTVSVIKKATVGDHGTDTGWVSTYGDGQAIIGDVVFDTSYWTIDGVSRNTNDWQESSSYGIQIDSSITIAVSVTNITMKYLDVGGNNGSTWPSVPVKAIDMAAYNVTHRSNIYLGYMHIHNVEFPFHSRSASNVTIEYCHIGPSFGKEGISHQFGDNWVIRWSKWVDNCAFPANEGGTAHIGVFNYSGGGDPSEADSDNWEIYGCTFIGSGIYTMGAADALIVGNEANNWKFYNNTIYNTGGNWGGYLQISGAGNLVRNVLMSHQRNYDEANNFKQLTGIGPSNTDETWIYKGPQDLPYHSGSGPPWIAGTVIVGSEDPFQDKDAGDFRLKTSFSGNSPLNVGSAVGAPYNQDMNGVTHDNIGAFATFGEGGGGSAGAPGSRKGSRGIIGIKRGR